MKDEDSVILESTADTIITVSACKRYDETAINITVFSDYQKPVTVALTSKQARAFSDLINRKANQVDASIQALMDQ